VGNTYIIYREAVDVCGRFGKCRKNKQNWHERFLEQ